MVEDFSEYKYPHERGELAQITPADMAKADEVLFASYGGAMYEGDAVVLFQRDGKLYEVHGGHCSCYGLEDQWTPAEVTWPALAMRRPKPDEYASFLHDHGSDAQQAFWKLVYDRMPGPTLYPEIPRAS